MTIDSPGVSSKDTVTFTVVSLGTFIAWSNTPPFGPRNDSVAAPGRDPVDGELAVPVGAGALPGDGHLDVRERLLGGRVGHHALDSLGRRREGEQQHGAEPNPTHGHSVSCFGPDRS
jgi:hypothetical protein